jgi:hypothetical protein
VRYALRGFRQSPGFALTVIGTIGLALGLNTTMFSVFNAYVLRPLAVRDPYSLYQFYWQKKDHTGHRFTWSEYSDLASQKSIFRSVIAFRSDLVSLSGEAVVWQTPLYGIGIAAALAVAPLFAHQLSAVDPFEPAAYGSAVLIVALAAGIACWHPSRRAAAVDPTSTLRCD